MAAPRICVIGAGPSGMSSLVQLKLRQDEGLGPFDITCFESQPTWGGNWNFFWRTGLNEHGEKVHGAMYNDLWTNGPIEVNEYPDYTLIEHFKKPIPSHPPRAVVFDYQQARWNKYDVKKFIVFNTAVRSVTFDDATDKFSVVVEKVTDQTKRTEIFDYVIVCTSFASTPYSPEAIPGIEKLTGRVMHSHDVRNEFRNGSMKDKSILLIGASFSAEDILLQSIKFGAKEIHVAYNRGPLKDVPLPAQEHPRVTHFEGTRTVHFEDGSKADVDMVIFCTGYRLTYPFMEEKIRFSGKTEWYQDNLYKCCLFTEGGNNRLFYPGTLFTAYTFAQYELQACWTSKVIAKVIELPPKEEMKAEIKTWLDRLATLDPKEMIPLIQLQTDYINDISKASGYGHCMDCTDIWDKTLAARHKDLPTYRDTTFESIHTGTTSVVTKLPFMQCFNDTFEDFKTNYLL